MGRYNSLKTVEVGTVIMYASTSTPLGWLVCDGSPIDRVVYAALFALLSTTHGQGNGTTTFNIPDYRGRFLRGVPGATGRDPGVASRTAMNTGGNTTSGVGSLQTMSQDGHGHGFRYANVQSVGRGDQLSTTFFPYLANIGVTGATNNFQALYGTAATSPLQTINDPTVQYAGNSESRPANAYVNYVIKY